MGVRIIWLLYNSAVEQAFKTHDGRYLSGSAGLFNELEDLHEHKVSINEILIAFNYMNNFHPLRLLIIGKS